MNVQLILGVVVFGIIPPLDLAFVSGCA